MHVLWADQARLVAGLFAAADERQTLRRYLRRQQATLTSHERANALDILVAICRDGYLSYEVTLAQAREKLRLA